MNTHNIQETNGIITPDGPSEMLDASYTLSYAMQSEDSYYETDCCKPRQSYNSSKYVPDCLSEEEHNSYSIKEQEVPEQDALPLSKSFLEQATFPDNRE